MKKSQYYKLAGVVKTAGAYASYDSTEGLVNMLKHHHWGPWDLSTMLGEKIPDKSRKVGKKKEKIGSKDIQLIKKEQEL